jgi:mono/diheme cytochrome c family protein
MIRAFTAGIGLVVFAALAAPASAQDKVQQGSALFTSQKCVLCHSVGAKGNKKGALDDVASKLKAEDIRQWLTNPAEMRAKSKATRMPEMKPLNLTKDQVDALVAFLQAQKGAAADVVR